MAPRPSCPCQDYQRRRLIRMRADAARARQRVWAGRGQNGSVTRRGGGRARDHAFMQCLCLITADLRRPCMARAVALWFRLGPPSRPLAFLSFAHAKTVAALHALLTHSPSSSARLRVPKLCCCERLKLPA
jgi:hypothetical protein